MTQIEGCTRIGWNGGDYVIVARWWNEVADVHPALDREGSRRHRTSEEDEVLSGMDPEGRGDSEDERRKKEEDDEGRKRMEREYRPASGASRKREVPPPCPA
jgi:hypothetical protein